MFDLDSWAEIFQTLKRHKLRTFLTAFGVIWGIFMLVMLLGITKGLKNGTEAQFGAARNSVFVWTGRPTSIPYQGLGKGRWIRLTDQDLAAMLSEIDGLDSLAPNNGMGNQMVTFEGKGQSYDLQGVTPFEKDARGFIVTKGRFINDLDMRERRKVAVIGEKVAKVLFGGTIDPIGKDIIFLGVRVTVVGVVKPSALNDWAAKNSEKVFMPNTSFRQAFNQGEYVHSVIAKPKNGVNSVELEKEIQKVLRRRKQVHPADFGVVGSYNAQENFVKAQGIFTGITLFSWTVAIGTILAGVIGVGNIMIISVKERTREIGLRKAIGARPSQIVISILKEACFISLVAGYIGLVLGVGALSLLEKVIASTDSTFFSKAQIDFTTAVAAIFILVAASILASWLPARNAARVDPVLALQSE